ncbi:MAG TPA: PAS domain S-box protein, partial [Anaerolineae bacterium]|nr:PAS domain S-box protein [Anaerolineae bacterium]
SPPLSTIHVVMDDTYPPYVFKDDGAVQGILVDQWKLWGERTGVKVEIQALPWGEALRRMQAGEFDVIDTIFYTGERAQSFDFTAPYARLDVPIFFQNKISGIATAGNLKGFRVAVKSGDDNAAYLISQGVADLAYYDSYEEIVQAAARGDEAIFVIDQPPALYFLYKYDLQDQFNRSTPIRSGEFHRAVKKGNAAVLKLVTDGFSRISPAEYQAIDERWLGAQAAQFLRQIQPYLEIGAALALLLILILFVFSWALRKRVRQRTRELEETLDALHESRRFLAELVEYSGMLIAVKDRDGRYELVNRKWEEVTGLPRPDVIGRTDEVLFPGPSGRQFRGNDLAVIEADTVLEMEELLEDTHGQRFFISTKFPLYGEANRVKGTCGMSIEITERKQAEEALRRSEDKFSKAFQVSPDVVSITRLSDGQFIEINEGFTVATGYAAAEVIGKTSQEINLWVTPADRERLVQGLREHDQVANLEISCRTKDGRIIVGLMSARLIDIHGEKCLLSITHDITERKQMEEALRESEERFRAMIEQASEGFALIDEHSVIIEWNRAQERIVGLTREEVLGRPVYEVQFQLTVPERRTPGYYTFLKAMTLEAVQTGQSPVFDHVTEMEVYRPDGQRLFVQQSVFPIRIGNGYRLGFMSLDITEHKQAEAALQESERQMRAIVDAAPFGAHLYELKADGRLVFQGANQSADQILQVDHRPFVGKTIEEAFPPLVETEIPAAYRQVAATGKGYQLDQIAYDDSGIRGAYELHAFQTGPNHMAVFFRDVTERKKMEDALRLSNEALEQRVLERTQELAAANARLTELDRLKSKFVSDVSHELRTPIANLKLYIDLLERGKPEKYSHYVTVLQQQVRRVAALVDDILDLSRLERRKEQGVSYEAVALNDVIKQVVLAHQPRAEANGLRLTFEPTPDLPPVLGDANQLAQVVTNLVANALSYTTAGYVQVSTQLRNERVCLCVEDSGSGIPAEDLPHIFERFYRGQLVLKNDIPGTGLGLAIVKEIVDLHQGQLEVDSRLGEGTIFRAWLPMAH